MALKSRSITLKTSSKPLILHRQNRTWQKIRAVKLLPSVTARILADKIYPKPHWVHQYIIYPMITSPQHDLLDAPTCSFSQHHQRALLDHLPLELDSQPPKSA